MSQAELNELAKIGSSDSMSNPDSKSIATTIVASVLYCTPGIISTISAVSAASVGASTLFSCTNNPAQCG
ncbi:hypothetical protein B5G18_14750 [Clostridium perfringens]|uniref:hypothetical protein n=1 Tax=Clostridium perfringens TaxID=1502 RepID=UPI000B37FBA6|nr:hypothetical protein [Clostridium perfringens]OUN49533.1 hypothetical protein B5G18_14750 [Clostridium perfringens]OUP41499.1 hypothetical protein B5F20_14415 [Clostridium perfringens]